MFHRILNVSLLSNLLQLEQGLSRTLPLLELHYGILDCPYLLILLVYIKHKSNEKQAKSNDQREKSIEERAKSNEQRAESNDQRGKSNEQQAMSKCLASFATYYH